MFFALLLLVTLIPLIAVTAGGVVAEWTVDSGLAAILIWISSAHVGATAFAYFDREYAPVVQGARWSFYGSLILGPGVVALLFFSTIPAIIVGAFWVFIGWQFYHYQRQNYGLLSLVAAADQFGSLPRRLNWVLMIPALGGAIAVLSIPGMYQMELIGPATGVLIAGAPTMRMLSVVIYAIGFLALGMVVARDRRFFRRPRVFGALLLAMLFFVPALVSMNPLVAFWSYAIAHGFQYLVMMAVCAQGSAFKTAGVLLLGVLTGGYMVIASNLSALGLWPTFYMLTVIHFVVDAKLWKLREPVQGRIVRERFAFALRHS